MAGGQISPSLAGTEISVYMVLACVSWSVGPPTRSLQGFGVLRRHSRPTHCKTPGRDHARPLRRPDAWRRAHTLAEQLAVPRG
jgi:hypothetical protein